MEKVTEDHLWNLNPLSPWLYCSSWPPVKYVLWNVSNSWFIYLLFQGERHEPWAVTRKWLQFVFPAYIWTIITAFIVVISRYSSTGARIVANSVQVLAMLLLLSYAKILCPLHHISSLLWWSIARIVVCLYGGNTQYTFHLHTSLSSEYNCRCVSMPPVHSAAFFI